MKYLSYDWHSEVLFCSCLMLLSVVKAAVIVFFGFVLCSTDLVLYVYTEKSNKKISFLLTLFHCRLENICVHISLFYFSFLKTDVNNKSTETWPVSLSPAADAPSPSAGSPSPSAQHLVPSARLDFAALRLFCLNPTPKAACASAALRTAQRAGDPGRPAAKPRVTYKQVRHQGSPHSASSRG